MMKHMILLVIKWINLGNIDIASNGNKYKYDLSPMVPHQNWILLNIILNSYL